MKTCCFCFRTRFEGKYSFARNSLISPLREFPLELFSQIWSKFALHENLSQAKISDVYLRSKQSLVVATLNDNEVINPHAAFEKPKILIKFPVKFRIRILEFRKINYKFLFA